MQTLEYVHKRSPSDTFFFIGGPCVIESREHAFKMAESLLTITRRLKIPFIFKSSYDKANRTSGQSYRGVGMHAGLQILNDIRSRFNIPVTTDVHETTDVSRVAEVVDVLQIPAFLCRQTDLLVAAARTGKIVNVKKGQFMAPWDMEEVVKKLRTHTESILLTERGTTFGYNNLVVDMRSFPILQTFNIPIVYDATHSLQLPGGGGTHTNGMRTYIPHLARAAVAAGIDGLFMEVHNTPEKALSDAATQFPLSQLETLLRKLLQIHVICNQLTPLNLEPSDTF